MFVLIAFISFAVPVTAGPIIAIRGGTVHPISSPPIPDGIVLIEGGKIRGVGSRLPIPPGATIIDAGGKVITPGFIDAHSHLGLVTINLEAAERDLREGMGVFLPHLQALDAFNPANPAIAVTRIEGVTTVLVAPGGDVLFGMSALMKLDGTDPRGMALLPRAALHAVLSGGGGEEAPRARPGAPTSRMGHVALLRTLLAQAREYRERRSVPAPPQGASHSFHQLLRPTYDPALEALAPVLGGELPLMVSVNRASDILTVLRLSDEFKIRVILADAAEGYVVADEIARRKVPVVVAPLTRPPGSLELRRSRLDNAAILASRGVRIAFKTDSTHNVRNLSIEAGLAMTYGLPADIALRALTLSPAEIFGVSRRVGSLERGKDADLVIWSGDPLEPTTRVERVFINGTDIPMRSHQTDLFERYR